MEKRLDISVVVPLYNEEESLPELTAWIDRVARENGLSYEIVFVDDGSTDGSWETLERLKEHYPALRAIGFARNYGKSAALYCGFAAAEGDVVFTMDADLQDSPDEIPDMRRMILEEGYDMVSGWKLQTSRPDRQTLAQQILQLDGAHRLGHQTPRLQLRTESLPPQGGQVDRSLRRDAPLHPDPGQGGRIPAHRREGSLPQGAQVRLARSSAWNAWSRATWT